jgi:hypothetical protein
VNIDLLVEGWTQTLSPYGWDVTMNCSPADAWAQFYPVADAANPVATDPRMDSDSSFLNAGITSSATSMVVGRATGDPLWDSTAVPFDVGIGGEQVTATAISGAGSTQTFTITRGVNGVTKAHAANEIITLWQPAYIAL